MKLGLPSKLSLTAMIAVLLTALALLGLWRFEAQLRPLDGDAVCFVPTALSLARHEGWQNPLYRPAEVADASAPKRFIWHGVVAPWLWAKFSSAATYAGVREGAIWVSWLGLVLLGIALVRRQVRASLVGTVLTALTMAGSASYFWHSGRPESVAATVVAATLLLLPRRCSHLWMIIAGMSLGVLAATTPAAAALLVPWVIIAVLYADLPVTQKLMGIALISLLSAGLAALLISSTGCSLTLWLKSMALHSKNVVWSRSDTSLKPYWIAAPERPFLIGTVLCLTASLGVARVVKLPADRMMRAGVVLCLVVFAALAWKTTIKPSPCVYNLFPLLVVLAAVAAQSAMSAWDHARRLPALLLIIGLAFPIGGLVRQAVVLRVASQQGMTVQAARERLGADLAELKLTHQPVGLTNGLFELHDGQVPGSPKFQMISDPDAPPAGVRLVQQANSGLRTPPAVPGFTLLLNRFDDTVPTVAGLPLARTTGSFTYALFTSEASVTGSPH